MNNWYDRLQILSRALHCHSLDAHCLGSHRDCCRQDLGLAAPVSAWQDPFYSGKEISLCRNSSNPSVCLALERQELFSNTLFILSVAFNWNTHNYIKFARIFTIFSFFSSVYNWMFVCFKFCVMYHMKTSFISFRNFFYWLKQVGTHKIKIFQFTKDPTTIWQSMLHWVHT